MTLKFSRNGARGMPPIPPPPHHRRRHYRRQSRSLRAPPCPSCTTLPPRLGLLFKGGFQGCGVPINNSLSSPHSVPYTHLQSSHPDKSVCAPLPLSAHRRGTFSKWRRPPPSLHSGKSQMCVYIM